MCLCYWHAAQFLASGQRVARFDRQAHLAHEIGTTESWAASLEKLHQDLQKQLMEFYEKKDSMLEKAAEKAGEIVDEAKSEAELVIRDLRKMRTEKHADIKEHELIEAKRRLENAAPEIPKSAAKLTTKKTKKNIFY